MTDRLTALDNLQIDCFKTPPRPVNLGKITAKLVGEVLDQLQYSGTWKITFLQRVRKKSDVRFQVLNRRENEIFLRTKPGDNSTTWELKLSPPSGYLPQEIYENLKRVPSSGIMKKNTPIPLMVAQPSKIPVITYPQEEKVESAPLTQTPVAEQPKPVQPVRPEVKLPEPKEVFVEKPNIPEKSNLSSFLAIPKDTRDVSKHPVALLHGLVALCCNMSSEGHIARTKAVEALINEMNLEEFIKSHPTYTSATKVATMIIKGLCDRGQISRYSPIRKPTRIRDNTKGYVLTPLGREKIRGVQDKLPEILRNRLFNQITVKAVKTPEESFSKLTGLTEQLIKTQKSLGEYVTVLDDLQYKKIEAEKRTESSQSKIASLKEQISNLNLEIERLQNDASIRYLEEINRDIHDCTSMVDTENHEVEKIKKQIIELMG